MTADEVPTESTTWQTFIVRLRRDDMTARELRGQVSEPLTGRRQPFQSAEELRRILLAGLNGEPFDDAGSRCE